jgi:putative nucleotidyltransferase with HDIG domain
MSTVIYPNPAQHATEAHDMASHVTAPLGEVRPRVEVLRFPGKPVAFSEVITALTYALDLASNESSGHTLRTCILGMELGQRLFLAPEHMSDLYYALLLKDVGTTSNSVELCELLGMDETLCRHAVRVFDWTRIEWPQLRFVWLHSFLGYPWRQRLSKIFGLLSNKSLARLASRQRAITSETIAGKFRRSETTIDAIRCLEERWDGSGGPSGLKKDEIPLLSQLCSVAQTLESFERIVGRDEAVRVIERRSGRWFDPGIVAAVVTMHQTGKLWHGVDVPNLMFAVLSREPKPHNLGADYDAFDDICSAFADVIDAKSHYTFLHSHSVAELCEAMGHEMQLTGEEVTTLRRAALLHDIGMLSIPNEILDKEGPLTERQRAAIEQHATHSYELLRRVRGFEPIAAIARSHHERLDGSGYPDALKREQICTLTRILSVADVYDALSSPRSYRDNLAQDEVLRLVESQVPHALDRECFNALRRILGNAGPKIVPQAV